MGYYSDRVETRGGRRKPFVIIGAPGLALTGFLLFVPNWFMNTADPSLELVVFSYYLFFICAFRFFYAILLTAFQAWLPEITDEDERPLVSSMQNTANWVANGLGVVVSFVTSLLFIEGPPPGLSQVGFTIVIAFALITVLFYLPSIVFIREMPGIVPPRRSMREETVTVLQNQVYVRWILVVGFLSFSFAAITAQVVGFAQEILLLNSRETLLPPALGLLASIIVFFYLWVKVIGRTGKGRLLFFSLTLLAILMAMTPVAGALVGFVSNVVVAFAYFIPLAACMAAYYLINYVVPADIAHVDELVTGKSRAGVYEGIKGVPLNMFQAASAVLLGWFMDYSVLTTGGTDFGYLWWGPVFAPFLLVAAFILRYTDIDPDFETLKAQRQIEVTAQEPGTEM
ncbi:MAG: MFS transporter [Candidatus Thorarchaeota archaeon]